MLGEIISAASGMDYYDYVRKFIFEPAGMKDSDWFEADAVVENVAEGYTTQDEPEEEEAGKNREDKANQASQKAWRKNIYTRPARGSAAGGGYATADDLLRFAQTLYECQLLDEAWTNWVFIGVEPEKRQIQQEKHLTVQKTSQVKNSRDNQMGKNSQKQLDRSRWSIGIAGGAPGINAVLEMDNQSRYAIIVLANYDPTAARDVARMVSRYLKAVKN